MTKLYFRLIVLVPVIALLAAAWFILVIGHPAWPEAAQQYVAWYQGSAPTTFEYWSARLGLIGLLGIVASSIGVMALWGPARYAYVAFALLAVAAEIPTTPVLIGLPEVPLDNLAKIFLGASVALMFTEPCAKWFHRAKKA